LLEFEEGGIAVDAVAEQSLASGALDVAMLDLLPDADGYGDWTNALYSHSSHESIATLLAGSEEVYAGLGQVGDGDYVDWTCDSLLEREGDAAGASYWDGELAGGMGRGGLALQFLAADEQPESYRDAIIGEVLAFGDLWAAA